MWFVGKSDEENYFRTYGNDADGEKGYEKQTHSKGNHGYKTRDTFHKQDGDNYGFEEHEAFGRARGKEDENGQAKSSKHKSKHADHEGAGMEHPARTRCTQETAFHVHCVT